MLYPYKIGCHQVTGAIGLRKAKGRALELTAFGGNSVTVLRRGSIWGLIRRQAIEQGLIGFGKPPRRG